MYCSKCGAYIPEGETVCVACGTDSSVADLSGGAAQTGAAATATEEYRQTLEQKQREQQQKNKEWAEQAYVDYKEHKELTRITLTVSSGQGYTPGIFY